jgi:hypothetical protein
MRQSRRGSRSRNCRVWAGTLDLRPARILKSSRFGSLNITRFEIVDSVEGSSLVGTVFSRFVVGKRQKFQPPFWFGQL